MSIQLRTWQGSWRPPMLISAVCVDNDLIGDQ